MGVSFREGIRFGPLRINLPRAASAGRRGLMMLLVENLHLNSGLTTAPFSLSGLKGDFSYPAAGAPRVVLARGDTSITVCRP